jgi:hypothetical protein
VSVQGRRLGELLATFCTDKWFLPSMRSNVNFQKRRILKTSTTIFAGMLFKLSQPQPSIFFAIIFIMIDISITADGSENDGSSQGRPSRAVAIRGNSLFAGQYDENDCKKDAGLRLRKFKKHACEYCSRCFQNAYGC